MSSALKFRDLEQARLHLAALKELFLDGKTNDAYVLEDRIYAIEAIRRASRTSLTH